MIQVNKHTLTYRPWKLGGEELGNEDLVRHVRGELEDQGSWSDYGELAMGAGPSVRIDLSDVGGHPTYRVVVGGGITIQAEYRSLERALDMAALFADLTWDIIGSTSWSDSDLVYRGK